MERGAVRPRVRAAIVLALALAALLPSILVAAGSDPHPAPTASPVITSTSPGDGATGVPQRSFIVVTFSNPMNTSSVSVDIAPFADLFRSWQSGDTVLAMANYSTPFLDCTLYTVNITGMDKTGLPLVPGPVPNPWSFRTGGCGNPNIASTSPQDGETGVLLSGYIAIDFSEVMNTSSVSWTFSDTGVGFTTNWHNETLVLQATTPLAQCTMYTVEITSGTDLSGLPLAPGPVPNPWSFTTGCGLPYIAWTVPYDGEVGVPLDRTITVAFNESMNVSSVYWTINPAVSFNWTWLAFDTVLNLTPTAPFASCTWYTLGVWGRDLDGNELVAGPVPDPWSFMTTCPGPYIVATSPADGETGFPVTAPIVVTFSEPMANATITMTPAIPLNLSWSPDYTVLTVDHATPFAECTPYTVAVDGFGASGVPLQPGPVPNPWTFTTTCAGVTVTLITPTGGEDWTGGTNHTIAWQRTGTGVLEWRLAWTSDGGASWTPIANGTSGPGTGSYTWSVPALDVTAAVVEVCVLSTLPVCDASGPFTIDSTPPYLVSHDPPDGAYDVLLTMFLTATFSEPMDATKTEAAFWMTPPGFIMSRVWPAPNVLVLQIENLRTATLYTWGFACSAADRSSPGNPLANCTETHSFTTEGGMPPPSVSLTAPLGGESWTGGTAHPVRFTVDNPGPATEPFTVTASYRYAGGTLGGTIGTTTLTVPAGVALDGQIPWTTPAIDAFDVIVNVTATNRTGATFGDESGPFEVDSTAPYVVSRTPSPGERAVLPDEDVVIVFSETMNRTATQGAVSITPDPGLTGAYAWSRTVVPDDTLTVSLNPLMLGMTYTVTVSTAARDDSAPGNPLGSASSWSFTVAVPPSVDLLAPDGGEDWTGGSVHDVLWTTSDPDDATLTLTLSYSLDGGADGFPYIISTGLVVPTGAGSLPWTLPTVDAGEVLVRVDVADAAGNTAADASAAVFIIDSTPPALLVSFPADGSTGHKTTRAIWFVWTERVDRASFVSAFGVSPDPGGLTFAWSVSNLGGDVVLVDHKPFASRTSYAATFLVSARDDSDPGNFLAAPVVVRFSTQPPPNVNPPVAKAVGHHQVEAGVPATFDGSASTGDIRDYTWRIADNQGRFVAVLVGVRPTYTFTEHGRYSVTLFVTDLNGLSDDDTIEIAVTSSSNSADIVFVGAAGAALLVAALIGATEAGRLAAFSLVLFPLYARKRKDEPAEQETRGMIRGYVLVHPGDSYTDIKRNLGLGNGTLTYHLTVLEREGIIRSQVRGSRKLFFPREARLPEDGGGLHEVQLRMLRAVQAIPGLAVTDLAGALGITSQLALYHLRDLAAKGRIRFERRGLRLRCYAEDSSAVPMD